MGNNIMPVSYFVLSVPPKEQLEQFKANRWIKDVNVSPDSTRCFVTKWWGKDEYLYKLKNSRNPLIPFRLMEHRGKAKEHCTKYLSTTRASNFSGVEIVASTANDPDIYATGNPHQLKYFGNAVTKPNPFFTNKDDGFVFVISDNWQKIEVFIFENGKNLKTEIVKMVQSGIIDVSEIRATTNVINPFTI